jgi:SMC interacting uncharacterized protein involved in chromosome segregation
MSLFQRKPAVPAEDNSQWTMETLREYLLALTTANDSRYSERFESSQTALQAALTAQQTAMQTAFTAQKLSVDAALAAADRAVNKAEIASEKRFESVNEFRETLRDQQTTFIPRGESAALFKAADEKLTAIQSNYDNRLEALRLSFEKSNENILKEIAGLRESRSESGGKMAGANALWGYIVAVAGIGLALIFHFIK